MHCLRQYHDFESASMTPLTAMRFRALPGSGAAEGVLNIVTCGRREAEIFLHHPVVNGITFVSSTSVGQHIYSTASAKGKRSGAVRGPRTMLVLEDAPLDRTARYYQRLSWLCGERCMALRWW